MTRLILVLLLVAVAVLAAGAIQAVMAQQSRLGDRPRVPARRDDMPGPFRTIAYGLLVILMFGVVTGWLGAA